MILAVVLLALVASSQAIPAQAAAAQYEVLAVRDNDVHPITCVVETSVKGAIAVARHWVEGPITITYAGIECGFKTAECFVGKDPLSCLDKVLSRWQEFGTSIVNLFISGAHQALDLVRDLLKCAQPKALIAGPRF